MSSVHGRSKKSLFIEANMQQGQEIFFPENQLILLIFVFFFSLF